MITARQITKAIEEKFGKRVGIHRDQPQGYCYFYDLSGEPILCSNFESSSVMVPRFNDLTLESWLEEFSTMLDNYQESK